MASPRDAAAASAGCRPTGPPSGRTSLAGRRARTFRAAPTRRSTQSCWLTRSQQLAGVLRVEVVGRDRVRLEEQVAPDPGVPGVERPRDEGGDVVGRARQPQVGVDQLALVAGALLVIETGERPPVRGARHRERPGTVPVRDAALPVEPHRAAAEGRDEPRQLGVDRATVVALVVVLGQHLVVRGDVVGEAEPGHQAGQRVVRQPLAEAGHVGVEVARLPGREVDEDEPAPGLAPPPRAGRSRRRRSRRPPRCAAPSRSRPSRP